MSDEMILGLLVLPLVIIGLLWLCNFCFELGQQNVLDAMREHERLEVAQYMNSGRFDKDFSMEQIAEMETMDVTEFHKLILTAARNQYQPFTS
jgi:hypothetical protein